MTKKPFPKQAKKVFTGKIYSVYQWEQEMYDGSFHTFERLRRSGTVSVIPVLPDKTILLSRQEQPHIEPFIGAFGGRCDDGELPLIAAKRELLEEAGLVSNNWKLLFEVNPADKIDWTIYSYIASDCKKAKDPSLDAGEKIESFTVTFDEFLKISKQKNFRDYELALYVYRIQGNKNKWNEFKNIFK